MARPWMPTAQLGAVVHDRAWHTGGTVLDGHAPSIAAGLERVEAWLAALVVLVKKPKVVAAQTALLVALDPVAMDEEHVRFAPTGPLPPKLAVWKAPLVERARDQPQPCAVDAQRAIERVLLRVRVRVRVRISVGVRVRVRGMAGSACSSKPLRAVAFKARSASHASKSLSTRGVGRAT